jgi:hypothetical protein
LNKHYYGSRSCKNCNPYDDLGIKYFSSSKDRDFKKDQKEHPEHYRYKIIRICETRKDAVELEIFLHNKFDVAINESFYNRSKQTSSKFYFAQNGKSNPFYGKKHTEETRKKIGVIHKRKKLSEKHKKRLSEVNKGENNFCYGLKGKTHPHYGKKHTEETLKKISESKKGENNYRFKGYYVTPFGEFSSSHDKQIKENNINDVTLRKWCKHNTIIITKKSYGKSKYLQENFDESIIGKSYKDIGFSFEPK